MSTFINIHALISHPSSLMNRDDSGLQKTCIVGGVTRTRISSQCLKRAIRTSDLYKDGVDEVSIRTNKFNELLELCKKEMPDVDDATLSDIILNFGPKVKTEKIKGTKETLKVFESVQPFSIGAIKEAVRLVNDEGVELKNLKKVKDLPALDVALSGRMDANTADRNIEAAMSVAHAFSTHAADIEVDWFTACDDLSEQGSGHLGTTEFSSGVFYRYANINVDLLASNLNKPVDDLEAEINLIIEAFAKVTPPAKGKTLAAPTFADCMLVTKSKQPLSLANAFRTPVKNNKDVMENSIYSMFTEYDKLVTAYDLDEKAKALNLNTDFTVSSIVKVNKLAELSI